MMNPGLVLPKPVVCVVCSRAIDDIWCTNNICSTCCKAGRCPSVAFCKAVKDGIVSIETKGWV